MSQWQEYSAKYLALSPREQYLILGTGVVAVFMVVFTFLVEPMLKDITQEKARIKQLETDARSTDNSIALLTDSLTADPNQVLNDKKADLEAQLSSLDQDLLALTSELINPVEMRYALVELLKVQKGVKLLAFEVLPAQPFELADVNGEADIDLVDVNSSDNINDTTSNTTPVEGGDNQADQIVIPSQAQALKLYRHGIKLSLQGNYFQLRDYLAQLQALKWKFYWQNFDYQLTEYPTSELHVEIYSLSTDKEFIGV